MPAVADDHINLAVRVLDQPRIESTVSVPVRVPGGRTPRAAMPEVANNLSSERSKLRKHGLGLDISVEHVGDRKQALLDAFQTCQEGRCSCRTSEYEKLEAIKVQSVDDAIRIRLKPRSGETIDESAVKDCLEYTVDKASKG